MASSLPIPAPPRTPTPPTPNPEDDEDGAFHGGRTVLSTITFDPSALSPMTDTFPGSAHFGSMNSSMNSPAFSDASLGPPPSAAGRNPFNFQTQTIKDTPVIAKSVCQTSSKCIPSSVVPASPSFGKQENPQNKRQRHLSSHRANDGKWMSTRLSPLLSEQAGNVFRNDKGKGRAQGLGLRISTNTQSATGFHIASPRNAYVATLTPSTAEYPYTFTKVNPNKQNIGQRRGHRYKHSSVSTQHQIFPEPPQRAPLTIPASLPVPDAKEAWNSMSITQTSRLIWCVCHILISGIVLYSSGSSLSMTALSHLVFFDALSATIYIAVDVFHNFDVWNRPSIRHPFGLERADVLGGFAMSILQLFMGFDLISHNLKHVLESVGSHTPHHPHTHERVGMGTVDVITTIAMLATCVSSRTQSKQGRVTKPIRFLQHFPPWIAELTPSHCLTLTASATLLILPLLSIKLYVWLDRLLCALIAISMFALGVKLAVAQGLMLLMSFSGKGVSSIIREIANEPSVTGIEEARFWQVHYGLCMANLKLRVKGVGIKGMGMGSQEEQKLMALRERINGLVKRGLGNGYGKGETLRWEVTVQFSGDGRA